MKKPMDSNKIEDYFTVKEAATYLGVSVETMRNWDKKKKLKAHRNPINRYRLYKKVQLDELLSQINLKK